ncbi:MAG: dihydroneopterin aldolase [Oscillospiraceae bacterium]|jgi:dihydroneopterin aldolase|nr:dihydroneopterin aldolase [Oscillospiraceae bacterium]
MQKIFIQGLQIYAYHGVHAHEREQGQPFALDITLWADMSAACTSDNLDDTVNYSRVIDCAAAAFTAHKFNLIERAAKFTSEAILAEFAQVHRLMITVHKPQAPVRQAVKDIAFTLELSRPTT